MFRVIYEPERGQRVPVRVWARAVTSETVRQLQTIASQPYVVDFVAAMADAHVADGVAVGTVFATESTVVPRALGGDLGCGMCALRLDDGPLDRPDLERLIASLACAIPTGDATHRGRGVQVPDALLSSPLSTHSLEHAREALAPKHLGTLGGGNHFIELDRDTEGALWLLIHSGSRGLGATIAQHHARAAEVHDSRRDGLEGLHIHRPEGRAYLDDVAWAFEFAKANRQALLLRCLDLLDNECAIHVDPTPLIDLHHNFVEREIWGDREVLVHRKGAVAAKVGAPALIPGSMGTASYIVEGLGNPDAFGSCSHGAGRVLTRKEARARIRPQSFAYTMRRVVYPAGRERDLVEEAPDAYRDITEVLEDQTDLVKRCIRLEPIAVLKG